MLISSFGGGHSTCCWEMNSGKLKWSLSKGGNHAVFSRDGKVVATTLTKAMHLVDAGNGLVLQKLEGHTVAIGQTEFSPDGSRVASLGGTQVWLWDVQAGKAIRQVQEKQKKVTQIKFSPSGKLLGVTSQDGGVRLYDSKTGELVRDFDGHDGMAWDVAFIDSETKVVSLGWDQRIRYWDVASGQETKVIRLPDKGTVANLTLFPGEQFFAVTLWRPVFEVHIFDTHGGTLLARLSTYPLEDATRFNQFRPNPEALAVSPKGDWLAGACNDGKTRVWSMKGMKA
jgi:WD40 repeat protein